MAFKTLLRASFLACALLAQCAFAAELPARTTEPGPGLIDSSDGMQPIIDRALDLIGVRYRRSGDRPQTGFDCSGFVRYVFRKGMGLTLPRVSREISKTGEPVPKDELEPGDLVFFDTMRHAFSHVGIYLGDHLFIHAPRTGETVRIDDLREHYWARRYNGARRVSANTLFAAAR
jgi:cell wall-associated NlpC family hydrolase